MNALLLFLALVPLAPDADLRLKKEIDELIEKLGHSDYKLREASARKLLEIGAPAAEAIKKGQQSADVEISERCKKLYPLLWTLGLEKRLLKFIAANGEQDTVELPFAKKWLETVGDTKASREMYANMARVHSEKLRSIEENPDRLTFQISEFAKGLYVRNTSGLPNPKLTPISEPDVTLFFFLGSFGNVRTQTLGISSTYYYQFFNSEWFTANIGGEKPSKELRTLFSKWQEKERYLIVLRRSLDIAVQHQITECLPTMLKICKDTNTTMTTRAMAMMAFSRLGKKEQINDLEPFLKETAQLTSLTFNGTRMTVQFRDVALGAMIQMSGQSAKDFGFVREPTSYNTITTYSHFAFADDEQRDSAHAKFQKWRSEQPKK